MNDKAAGASPGLSEELGPLPEPEWWLNKPHGTQYYTADQMRAYAAKERAAERENCARLCDVIEDGRLPDGSPVAGMAGECAWAIREGIAA